MLKRIINVLFYPSRCRNCYTCRHRDSMGKKEYFCGYHQIRLENVEYNLNKNVEVYCENFLQMNFGDRLLMMIGM